MVPSLEFFVVPRAACFSCGSSWSHRLKPRVEKGDRRGVSGSIDGNKSDKLESTNAGTEDLCVNKLRNDVIESLNIDEHETPGSEPPYDKNDFQKEDSAINQSCSSSTSLPTTLKPVSAMKGSREKHRAGPPQKLTVKWAPDVYDPVPTSVSHAVTKNKPQKQSKKNSKSKQKNGSKSSRGNKHKKRGLD